MFAFESDRRETFLSLFLFNEFGRDVTDIIDKAHPSKYHKRNNSFIVNVPFCDSLLTVIHRLSFLEKMM